MRVGIDMGGHTMTASLVSLGDGSGARGKIERSISVATPEGRGADDVIAAMAGAVMELSEGRPVESVGVAVPGMLDAGRRRAVCMPNFPPEWVGLEIPMRLGRALGGRRTSVPVSMENDANCYALGEGIAGEAAGLSDFVVFTLGTGIGCGIVTGGRLLTGARGMAGECGHLVVSGDAPCGCGGRGHAETLAAADGTSARAAALGLPEDFKELWAMRGKNGKADAVLDETIDAIARAAASACVLLDPEMVILGGGMSRAEGLLEEARARALAYLPDAFGKFFDIRTSKLGDSAPVFGAASVTKN
jgi:glucokinase